jgi:uncharacterized Ntn-hydrolase superfamily protein
MSAALVVVEGRPPLQPGGGTVVDLRVDRSDDPLRDLAALLDAADAYAALNRAVEQLLGGDPSAALGTIGDGLAILPGEPNLRFVRAEALFASGSTEAGLAELRSLAAERSTWKIIARSFVTKGLIALPEGLASDMAFG